MDEKRLRSFLVMQPRPVRIVVHREDGDASEVAVAAGSVSWAQVARTILALEPAAVEVYDDAGKLLRSVRCDDEPKATAPRAPEIPPALLADPETARLTHFANLLAAAYDNSTRYAFEKMVDLYALNNERMVSVESRLERSESQYRRAMQERLDDAFDQVEAVASAQSTAGASGADPMDLFMTFMQAMQAGRAARKPNGAPNGATNGTTNGTPNGGHE